MMWAVLASLAVITSSAAADCRPTPGMAPILSDASLRWLVFGEMHGTTEAPEAFAELVCAATESGRPIAVALERPADEQASIDAFIGSDGGDAARRALLASPGWRPAMQDGRSSRAMLALLDRLRRLAGAGHIRRVVAVQPAAFSRDFAAYERMMADAVAAASPTSETLVLVLVGNIHARTTPLQGARNPYMPMAGLLPSATTRTFDVRGNGGLAWACVREGGEAAGPPHCGPTAMGRTIDPRPRGLGGVEAPGGAYAGVLYLGEPTSASPPAAGGEASAPKRFNAISRAADRVPARE